MKIEEWNPRLVDLDDTEKGGRDHEEVHRKGVRDGNGYFDRRYV
jgi:hypothetical protein